MGTPKSVTPGPGGDTNTRNSPSKARTPSERLTRNSPMKSGGGTPTERSTRNSPMKTDTPVDRMTRYISRVIIKRTAGVLISVCSVYFCHFFTGYTDII